MIIIQAQDLSIAFGEQKVLDNVSLAINQKEKIGLVGVNGSGKTTLLQCLTKQIEPDRGEIYISSLTSVAYLEQLPDYDGEKTAWNVVMDSFSKLIEMRGDLRELEHQMAVTQGNDLAKLMDKYAVLTEEYERSDGYACETDARKILVGLGFDEDEYHRPINTFSGGQKTRLNLARLLAIEPDILFLDEPTNHLDISSVEWLEEFLQAYSGTIIVVSHDRTFLDKVATRIVEINHTKLYFYPGNYSNYVGVKALNSAAWAKAYQKQQEYIQKTESYIARFRAGIKSKQAHGRQQQLNRLERMENISTPATIASWNFKMQQESGMDVLRVEEAAKSYGRMLFNKVNIHIRKGDKVALVGANGSGKTTLLKIILGVVKPDSGNVIIGSRVIIGYFAQEFEDLDPNKTALEEIIYNFDITIEAARTLLGGMLFSGDDVLKKVGSLSGGEKARIAILKLLLTGANFLVLDEPTNHLDIESCMVIEEMLANYSGTILMVSHDRYFVDQVANQILALEDGTVKHYLGNYSYYHINKKETVYRQGEMQITQVSEGQLRRLQEKEKLREERRLQKGIAKIEEEIESIEKEIANVETLLANPDIYADADQVIILSHQLEKLQDEAMALYEEWEELLSEA